MAEGAYRQFMDSAGSHVVKQGKYKGRSLQSLKHEELVELGASRARTPEAEYIRKFQKAQTALAALACVSVPKNSDADPLPQGGDGPLPQACQIVTLSAPKRVESQNAPPSTKQGDEKFMSVFEFLVQQFLAIFPFTKPRTFVFPSMTRCVAFVLVCALAYHPLGKVPAKIIGWVLRGFVNRVMDVWSLFWQTLQDEVGDVFHGLWGLLDNQLTGNNEAYPFGKAAIYAALGAVGTSIFRMRVIPRF